MHSNLAPNLDKPSKAQSGDRWHRQAAWTDPSQRERRQGILRLGRQNPRFEAFEQLAVVVKNRLTPKWSGKWNRRFNLSISLCNFDPHVETSWPPWTPSLGVDSF